MPYSYPGLFVLMEYHCCSSRILTTFFSHLFFLEAVWLYTGFLDTVCGYVKKMRLQKLLIWFYQFEEKCKSNKDKVFISINWTNLRPFIPNNIYYLTCIHFKIDFLESSLTLGTLLLDSRLERMNLEWKIPMHIAVCRATDLVQFGLENGTKPFLGFEIHNY